MAKFFNLINVCAYCSLLFGFVVYLSSTFNNPARFTRHFRVSDIKKNHPFQSSLPQRYYTHSQTLPTAIKCRTINLQNKRKKTHLAITLLSNYTLKKTSLIQWLCCTAARFAAKSWPQCAKHTRTQNQVILNHRNEIGLALMAVRYIMLHIYTYTVTVTNPLWPAPSSHKPNPI